MTNPTAILRRLLLVLAFTAGAWEDLLVEGADVGFPASRPACDLGGDEDADDGYVLNDVPPEAQVHLERGFRASLTQGQRREAERSELSDAPPFARRIFHVPLG